MRLSKLFTLICVTFILLDCPDYGIAYHPLISIDLYQASNLQFTITYGNISKNILILWIHVHFTFAAHAHFVIVPSTAVNSLLETGILYLLVAN